MNFPEVPFDETLFESNEMMRNYWDRATEKRSSFVAREDHDELEELTYAGYAGYSGYENIDREVHNGVVHYSTVEKHSRPVQPKASTDATPQVAQAEAPAAAVAPEPAAPAVARESNPPLSRAVLGLNNGQWALVGIAVVILFFLYFRSSSRY